MFHFEFVFSKQKLSNKGNIITFQSQIFLLCDLQAVTISPINTEEISYHRVPLRGKPLKFCLREEDTVTKWWTTLKTLWHIEQTSASCFCSKYMHQQNTCISLCNVSPWTACEREWWKSNPVKTPRVIVLFEGFFLLVPQENTSVS